MGPEYWPRRLFPLLSAIPNWAPEPRLGNLDSALPLPGRRVLDQASTFILGQNRAIHPKLDLLFDR